MTIYQNMITKTLKRMERKFDYHLGSNCIQVWFATTAEKTNITPIYLLHGSKVLDQYRTEKGEIFQTEYVCSA
jgi:hypothetical protein